MIETVTCQANCLRFTALRLGEGERLALLLHGFPDDPRSFVPVMHLLTEQGFTAVAPYMRGYAPSQAGPDCAIPSLGRDAIALVQALGHERALLIDRLWRDWSPGFEPPPGRLAEIKATLRRAGTARAALTYYRALGPRGMLRWGSYGEAWRLVHQPISTPTWVLTGDRDGCIGAEVFTDMESAFAGPWRLQVVPGAGHFLPLEAPNAVAHAATAPLEDDDA